MEEKVKAIKEAPAPTNVTQLHSFLGLINYYKFLPNLAANITPLYSHLNKHQRWGGRTSSKLPSNVPKMHCSQTVFLPTMTPASHWCWHATPQIMVSRPSCHTFFKDGKDRPIAYISRTLSAAEKHHSQLSFGHHLCGEEVSLLSHRQAFHH